MTTAPYAKLRANIAGAGNLTGALVGAAGATCQLSQDPAGLGSSWLYEITDCPEGFAQPAGWFTDVGGNYYYQGLTPPSFTLPALPLWGKLMFRLTVNNGDPGTSGLPATQFVDSSTVASTPDPSGNGFEDIAYRESNQWDNRRKWMGPLKRNIRRMAKRALPDYTSVADGYVLSLVGGVPTWVPGVATFSGDFGALFAGYGLTVRSYRRGDLGVTGTTGTGKSAWANQAGDGSTMVPGSAASSNGIGSVGAGLNGKASVVTNGASQNGSYTHPTSFAPATTNHHVYAVERVLAGCTSSGLYMHSANSNPFIYMATPGTAEMTATDGAGALTTSGVAINQYYRLRASFTGSASDVFKVGAHAVTPAAVGTGAPGTQWGFGSAYNGTSLSQIEALLLMHIEGPLATFLTACADADVKLQSFWSSAIEI